VIEFVAFDMDGTLVDVASSWAEVHRFFGENNDEGLRLFLAGQIDDEEFIRRDVAIWKRHRPDLTADEVEEILEAVPLMPGAEELFRELKRRHITTAIVSGGLDLLARRLGRELAIDLTLANGLRVDATGHLTGEGIVRVPVMRKEAVVAQLQQQLGVPTESSAAVGNSEIDVGMFRRSSVGIAFLPDDPQVTAGATHVIREKDLRRVLDFLEAGGPEGR
jgi:phosphoserine phosphatase